MAIEDLKRSEILDVVLTAVYGLEDITVNDRVLFLVQTETLPQLKSASLQQLEVILNSVRGGKELQEILDRLDELDPPGAPSKITDFAVSSGTIPQTEMDITFTESDAHADGSTIQYDVVIINGLDDTVVDSKLAVNVSTSDTIINLQANTSYKLAIMARNANDVTKYSLSNIEYHTTDSYAVSIDSLLISDAVDDYHAVIETFTSTGIDEYIVQIDDSVPPADDDAGWSDDDLPEEGVDYVDFTGEDIASYTIYIWGRHSSDDGGDDTVYTEVVSQRISVFTTDLIPDGGFDDDAANGTAFDAIYGSGGGGIFTRSNVECVVDNDICYVTNNSGAAGYLGITIPVTELTEYNIAFGQQNDLASMVLDIDTSAIGTYNTGDLVAGEVISNSTDTNTSFTVTAEEGGGSSPVEAFATDCANSTEFDAEYGGDWTRVDCDAECTSGVVTLTCTNESSYGYIHYEDTVVDEDEYTLSIETQDPSQVIIGVSDNATSRDAYNDANLVNDYAQFGTLTETQHPFTANGTSAYYSISVNSNAAQGGEISFRNLALIGASGSANLHVSMWVGSSINGDGFQLARVYGQPTGQTEPPIPPDDPPSDVDLLFVTHENRTVGSYSAAQITQDYHINENGWNEYTQFTDIAIANDPLASGRGKVLSIFCAEGLGWDKFYWKADFPEQDDVYMAYDLYIPAGNTPIKQCKIPGLIYGAVALRDHTAGVYPTTETLRGIAYIPTIASDASWGRGDWTLELYYYDKEWIGGHHFCDETDPSWVPDWNSPSTGGDQYHISTGEWVTLEFRLKMNTIGDNDGLSQIWVKDSNLNGGAATLVESHSHIWRATSSYNGGDVHVDGVEYGFFFGGEGDDPDNQPDDDEYYYLDNLRVSTGPIIH